MNFDGALKKNNRFGRLTGIIAAASLAAAGCGGGGDDTGATTSAKDSAPQGSPAQGAKLSMTIVGFESQSAFWKVQQTGTEQAGKNFDIDTQYVAPQQASEQGMVQLLKTVIAKKPTCIGITYTSRALEDVTRQAIDEGIDVMLFNNDRFEKQGPGGATTDPLITGLSFVGQNESTSGEKLAESFKGYIKKKGKVLIVNPFPQAYVLTLRAEGVKRVLEPLGYTTEVLTAGADEGKNRGIIGSYLQANKDTVGVVGLGTPAANPAAGYIDQQKLDIPVATFDIDSAAFNNVKAGRIKVALNQQPFLQSYFAVQNCVLKNRDGFTPVNVNTGTLVVEQKNAADLGKLIEAGRG